MSFFTESIKEFDHVVWPTKADTAKYFNIVVVMIVVLTVFLFIVGTLFSVGLFSAKEQFAPLRQTPVSDTAPISEDALKNLDLNVTGTTPAKDAAPAATPTK